MATTQTLTLHLPIEVAARIQDAVDQGDYASSEEVITDALRGWTDLRLQQEESSLRAVCKQVVVDQRPGLDPEPVFARLKKRFAAPPDGNR